MSFSPKLSVKDFYFGVELELGIEIEDFEDEFGELGEGWRSHDEHCGTEIVSPRMRGYAGLLSVRRVLRDIWDTWDKISFTDAGLHVHVDIQHFTLKHAKRLLTIASLYDEAIFAMMDGARYNNQYAKHCRYNLEDINGCITIADLQKLQTHDRYHGLNMYAFPKHGTVEFRYAMATADWTRVYSLISLYLRMVSFAGSNLAIDMDVPDVPKWSSSGLKFAKKKLVGLEVLKNKFFDMLQIRGNVRSILDEMFDENALDTRRLDEDDDYFEYRKPVRGLKQRKVKTN